MNEELRTRKGTNVPKMIQPWWWVRPEPSSPWAQSSTLTTLYIWGKSWYLLLLVNIYGCCWHFKEKSFGVSGLWVVTGNWNGSERKARDGNKRTRGTDTLCPNLDLSNYLSVPQQLWIHKHQPSYKNFFCGHLIQDGITFPCFMFFLVHWKSSILSVFLLLSALFIRRSVPLGWDFRCSIDLLIPILE